jgi:hypothetical protein
MNEMKTKVVPRNPPARAAKPRIKERKMGEN